MKPQLDDLLKGLPAQTGNGGHPPGPQSASPVKRTRSEVQLDKTTESAKLLLEEEADQRAEKTARLKAARQARDENES